MFRMYSCCVLLALGLYLEGSMAKAECGGTVLGNSIDDIRKQLADLQSVNAKQATEIRTLQAREAAQASKLRQLEGTIASRTSPIAFMARNTDVQNLGLNSQIAFQQVLLNQGNRYSTSSSKFSCPDDGVYVFITTILSSPTSPTYFAIVQDGATRGSGYTGSGGYSSATEMAVVKCRPGSYVWVKCHSTFNVSGQKAWVHSYFGGFRV